MLTLAEAAVRASRGELEAAQALLLRARRVAELEHARPAVTASTVANLGADDPARGELLGNLASFYARHREEGAAEHLFVPALAALEHVRARDARRAAVLNPDPPLAPAREREYRHFLVFILEEAPWRVTGLCCWWSWPRRREEAHA